jgi:CHAT domain-containing protein/tetratricopeptide (TPR) repeat protein
MKQKKLFVTLLIFIIHFSLFTGYAQSWEELIQKTGKYLSEKNKDSSLATADRALKLAINSSPSKHALTLGMIGQIYFDYGNYDKAAEYFLSEKNLKQTFLGKTNTSYAVSLNNLSSAYQELGRYQEAEQLLLEAVDIKNSANIKDTILAKSYHNLGKLYHSLGEYSKSEKYYLMALDIKKKICGESHPLYANTLYNLGLLHKSFGNFQYAEKELNKAYDIYKRSGDETMIRQVELQLAMVYKNLKKDKEFSEILFNNNAQNIDESSPDAGTTLYELALLNIINKDYKNAESMLQKAKVIIDKQYGKSSTMFISCLNALGIVNWMQDNLDDAYKYLNQVVSLRQVFYGEEHPEYASAIHNLAGLQVEMKDYPQADKNYSEALSIYLVLIKNYFPFLSETEKSRFNQNIKERFDMFYNYVLQRKDANPVLISEMFNYRLATKGILLNNSRIIKAEIENRGDAFLSGNYNKLLKIKEQLSIAYRLNKKEAARIGLNIDSLESAANELEKSISGSSITFKNEYEKKDITWKDIASKLDDDEAAVEIVAFNYFSKGWTDQTFYVALIIKKETTSSPELVIIDRDNLLEKDFIANYINSIRHKIEDKNSYKAFWQAIDEKLTGKKKLYVSDDGVYNKINLNTLLMPDNKYLFEQKEIISLTNISDILKIKEGEKPLYTNNNAELFGSPAFDYDLTGNTGKTENSVHTLLPTDIRKVTITSLPGTLKEVEDISNLLNDNKWQAHLFFNAQATVTQVKQTTNIRLLHIATHGFFLDNIEPLSEKKVFGINLSNSYENPYLRTGLLFTGAETTINNTASASGNSDDGILTAYDVLSLNIGKPELVVLSACETGLGDIKNGEGVYGLQRAFQIDGARNIIMSLWKVDDEITSEFMDVFYKKWIEGSSIHDALKEARQNIKEKYPEPYYWGAFVLIGE